MNEAAKVPAGRDTAIGHNAMIAMVAILALAMIGGLAALLFFSM